ncbi:DUF423 domain-containing protein [Flavobacteriales bacterium]|nr:DUF423 domain-containing protein [Flavobacteriales bacterium]
MKKKILITCGISGIFAVSLGALGAHALKALISTDQLKSFETASDYHLIHTLALMALIPLTNHLEKRYTQLIYLFFVLGLFLFSGSIYALATKELLGISSWASVLGPITPIGGLCFIAGWTTLLYAGFKYNSK